MEQKRVAQASGSHRERSKTEVRELIRRALKKRFRGDTVDVTESYLGQIRVVVVSRKFDKLDDDSQQALLWQIIDGVGLSDEERSLISFVLPASPALLA